MLSPTTRGMIRSGISLLALLLMISTVSAHGYGKQVVAEEEAGPYTVSVWIDPATPTIHADMHLTVSVSYEAEIVHGANITIQAEQIDTNKIITTTATHDQAVNKLFYEGELALKNTGKWLIEVNINGEHGQGQTTFDLTVTDEKNLPIEWLVGGGIFAVIVIGGVAYELRKRARNEE